MTSTNPQTTAERIVNKMRFILTYVDQANRSLTEHQPGYPTNTRGGSGQATRNDAGTPNGLERYLFTNDEVAKDLKNLHATLRHIEQNADNLIGLVVRWTTAWDGENDHPDTTGCVACARICLGGQDRLRSGLCNACYMDWRRHNEKGTERGEWMIKRRRSLDNSNMPPDRPESPTIDADAI